MVKDQANGLRKILLSTHGVLLLLVSETDKHENLHGDVSNESCRCENSL